MSTAMPTETPVTKDGVRAGRPDVLQRAVGHLHPRLAELVGRLAEGSREAARRIAEAARDARYRLRTGRPRGVPVNFVHPPLECSKACSQAARRVHGLLFGYSLAYEEVRPRAETIAQALGYSKSTTYNAIGELRRAGLLVVHERRGGDHRRIANRYDVIADTARALPEFRRGLSELEKRAPQLQKTRIEKPKSQISNTRTTIVTTNSSASTPTPRRPEVPSAPPRRQSGGCSTSNLDFDRAVGESMARAMRAAFGDELGALRKVVDQEHALEHPRLLRAACEAMLKKPGALDNPAGYLRSILRRQLRELEGAQQELLELEEEYRQACLYEDPTREQIEQRIECMRAAVEGRDPSVPHASDGVLRACPAVTPLTVAPSRKRPAVGPTRDIEARDEPRSAESVNGGLEQTVLRLKRSNLAAAKIVALYLPPEVAEKLLAPAPRNSADLEAPRSAAAR